jgi:hypothetical protein
MTVRRRGHPAPHHRIAAAPAGVAPAPGRTYGCPETRRYSVPAKRRIGLVVLVFFLGVILGSVVGELIGLLLPEDNIIRTLFVSGKEFQVGPVFCDLIVFTFTIGFTLKVNLISVLGIVLVAFLLRLYV